MKTNAVSLIAYLEQICLYIYAHDREQPPACSTPYRGTIGLLADLWLSDYANVKRSLTIGILTKGKRAINS